MLLLFQPLGIGSKLPFKWLYHLMANVDPALGKQILTVTLWIPLILQISQMLAFYAASIL